MPITFPATRLTVVVEIALGVDPSSDPTGWSWTNITSYVRYEPQISISRGRRDESSRVDAASARLTLDNRDGRFVRRNPLGAYYGQLSKNTPIRIGVNPGDGVHYRFHGFVNEWPTRWDVTGRDSNVPITCAGVLRRLTRQRRLRSAMSRGIPATSPHAWWPLENDAVSGLAGGIAMSQAGQVNFGVNGDHPGSAPLPDYSGGGRLTAPLPNGSSSTSWRMEFTARFGTGSDTIDDFTTPMDIRSPNGNVNVWEFLVSTGNACFQWSDTSGGYIDIITTNVAVDDGRYHHFRADVAQSGGDILAALIVDGVTIGTKTLVGKTLNSTNSKVVINPLDEKATWVGTVGQVTWWSPYTPTAIDTAVLATGWLGEAAADRMQRLCDEESVPFTTAATTSTAMGPQAIGTLLDALRDCETADQGLLYELEFGLGYLAISERYNTASELDLDFNTHDIAEPPEPADDDQRTVNRYTASRASGSSVTIEDADSIAVDGLYESSGTFNVETDAQVEQVASWNVHKGTIDEDYWPAVPIRFARTPALIPDWVALSIGARITIANPPDQVAPDTIGAIAEGWQESITPHMWEAVLSTTPASLFDAFEVEASANRGRLDTAGCVLAEAVNSSATALKFATTSGPLWINSTDRPGDFPFDVGISGQRNTVTAIAKQSISFVAAGTASTGSSGSRTPGAPAGIATGDLVLIFASTRNSGTGIPDTPANWSRLEVFEAASNAQLFARKYDGVWTMPTVTYTGGAANEDTIAQSAAFRSTFYDPANVVVAHASALNASAQDISTPGVPITDLPTVSVAIYLGWKQDDYTSVATPGSWNEIQEASSTAGNDASQVWGYRLFTTMPSAGSLQPTIAVTGGASAISRGGVIILRPDYQAATVTRGVGGVTKALAAGDAVSLWKRAVIAL